jgi:ankyrin repeat protein
VCSPNDIVFWHLINHQENGATPLYIAAQEGHDTIVAALLSHPGVDVNNVTVCTSCICNTSRYLMSFDMRINIVCVASWY